MNRYIVALLVLLSACSFQDAGAREKNDTLPSFRYRWTAVKADRLDSLQRDTAVAGLIRFYKDEVDRHVNQVIGHTRTGWNKEGDENSSVSVFMTDLIRNYAKQYLDVESDISIMNLGGMRSTLTPGPIRLYDIYALSPFDNRIVALEMKGSSIRNLVADIVGIHSRFEGISGMELVLEGNQVKSISVGGKELEDDRIYKVVTIDFLYNGGDGLGRLQEAVSMTGYDVILREAIITMIEAQEKKGETTDIYPEIRVIKEGVENE